MYRRNQMAENCQYHATAIRLANEYLERGDEEKSLKVLSELLCIEPDHVPALELQAKSLMRLGKFERALDTVNRLLLLNPFEIGYVYLRGQLLQASGVFSLALEDFNRCIAEGGPEKVPAMQAAEDLSGRLRTDTSSRRNLTRQSESSSQRFARPS